MYCYSRNLLYLLLFGFMYFIFFLFILTRNTASKQFLSDTTKHSKYFKKNVKGKLLNKVPIQSDIHMKYILLWNAHNPFHLLREADSSFILNQCPYFNCYITYNRTFLQELTEFDAVVFSGCALKCDNKTEIPTTRSPKQKYAFANLEPAPMHPITNPLYDNFFNWTWTYRLDSDITWKYVTVYDLNDVAIGPETNMKWIENLEPTSEDVKKKLARKTKAVAWIVSHCRTASKREYYVNSLKGELKKYDLSVDVFGGCGDHPCSRSVSCNKMLERDYYFYLSFENSLDQDYVTEKLLFAMNNLMVPVVYGGADYNRFLPPGSYLNAIELGPQKLAETIDAIIKNKSRYSDFFRWTNHFKYEASEASRDICNICSALNDESFVKETSVIHKFREWWNGSQRQKVYDFLLAYFIRNRNLLTSAVKYNFTLESSQTLFELLRRGFNVTN